MRKWFLRNLWENSTKKLFYSYYIFGKSLALPLKWNALTSRILWHKCILNWLASFHNLHSSLFFWTQSIRLVFGSSWSLPSLKPGQDRLANTGSNWKLKALYSIHSRETFQTSVWKYLICVR